MPVDGPVFFLVHNTGFCHHATVSQRLKSDLNSAGHNLLVCLTWKRNLHSQPTSVKSSNLLILNLATTTMSHTLPGLAIVFGCFF